MVTTHIRTPSSEQRNGAIPALLRDVLEGLRSSPKRLPCKYFYDEAGSKIFDAVCNVDEYYLTRTELGIMADHAPDMADLLGEQCVLIEYGSGSSIKTRLLLDHLVNPVGYVPVDISGKHLRESARQLANLYPKIPITPVCADFTAPFETPDFRHAAKRRVVYFPGSTIGNLTPPEAITLLRQSARRCGQDGVMLLGVDLKKDPAIITAAYNDAEGVSAAFNLNLLARINRELGANFRLDQFWHHALYHPVQGRIEMCLVSREAQIVEIQNNSFRFAEGESILTEYSYKYSLEEIELVASSAGFSVDEIWMDDQSYFAVCLLRVAGS